MIGHFEGRHLNIFLNDVSPYVSGQNNKIISYLDSQQQDEAAADKPPHDEERTETIPALLQVPHKHN